MPKYLIFFWFVCTSVQAETLVLLNWEAYLSEDVIAEWEQTSGHTLKQIYYDNDEARDEVMVDHKDQDIDLVVVDEIATRVFGEVGVLVASKDYKNTPNLDYIDSVWRKQCGDFGIPYMWGTLGLAYRSDKLSKAPDSWDDLLNPKPELSGHIGLVEDYTDLLAPGLISLGYSINSQNEEELKQAFTLLKNIVPHVLTFDYAISYLSGSEAKDELHMALVYSGDQYALNEKAGSEVWEYTTQKEGTVVWVDCLVVMNDSKRKDIAYDFLNYIFQPEVAARNSEEVYVATTMAAAKELQSEEFISDQTVYPKPEIMAKAQFYTRLSEENTLLRNRITSALLKTYEAQ